MATIVDVGGWLIGVGRLGILSNSGNQPLPTLGRDSPSMATIAEQLCSRRN